MNFGTLKSHFNDLLNRSDITTTLTERFIEQSLSRIQRQLRTPMSERVLNITITSQTESVTLPSDFLEIISLYKDEYELERISMRKYREIANTALEGKPRMFVRQAEKLLLYPQPTSGTLTLYYHAEYPPLSADSDENVLTQSAPDLIIYGALSFAADYYLDQRAEIFEGRFQQFLTELQEQANDQELQGGTQSVLPAYTFQDE